MKRSASLIFVIVFIDSIGIGIVFPTLPGLLRTLLNGSSDVAGHYGFLLAAYAATMFFSSPVLGLLSDRYGRRPLLLLSLFGTAFDDLVMALAHSIPVLYLGRMLAGITGANFTVANAYLADITSVEERSAAYGRMNACFGVGFIAGPALGGLLGAYSLRAPFYLAAALNAASAVLCFFALPESRIPSNAKPQAMSFASLNPLTSLRSVSAMHGMSHLLYIFCTIDFVGQIPGVLWVIYGVARFGWSPVTVGLSLALFGLMHALCQAFLTAWTEKKCGRRGTILLGIACDATGFTLFSLAGTTVAAFCIMPLLCLGGVALPALQSLLSGRTSEERQGELQGVLTSFNSLVAITGPLLSGYLYEFLRSRTTQFPGSIWLVAPLLYAPCVVILLRSPALRSAQSVQPDSSSALR